MTARLTTVFIAISLAILSAPHQCHATDNALELMRLVYGQGRAEKSQRMDMEILIKNKNGGKRVRFFKMLYKISGGKTKSLLRFHSPANIKGTGLFNIVYDGKDKENDQWIYFPAFRTVSKLSVEEKHRSFMGSDFTNSDIVGRKPGEDTHTLVRSDERVSVVTSVPKNSADPYSKIESHIIKRIKVPEKIVFYDRSGNILKTLMSRKIVKTGQMYLIMEAEMENHLTGGSTYLTKKSVNFKKIKKGEVSISRLQNR